MKLAASCTLRRWSIYSASALRQGIFPLLIIIVMPLLGGNFDAGGLLRAAAYAAAGIVIAMLSGYFRWSTTTYWIDDTAIHHHTGLLRERDTKVPLERVEGLDVHQGPLQRAFGVFAVDVQTGAAKKGGEIALPALTASAVDELRAFRVPVEATEETGRSRKLSGRELAVAALTAGQLGIVLPVIAALGQVAQQVGEEEQQGATRFLPHSVTTAVLIVLALLVAAWVLSTLGSIVAFGGFTIVREQDRIRIRRGLVSRNEATVPVGRVRAVRVVEGVFRRPFGLCALTVEVLGYADEASAARTIFPLVRVRDVRAFLEEFLPELADDAGALSAPTAASGTSLPAAAGAARARDRRRGVVPGRRVRDRCAAADRALRVGALAGRRLAPRRRPARRARNADRPRDRARSRAAA